MIGRPPWRRSVDQECRQPDAHRGDVKPAVGQAAERGAVAPPLDTADQGVGADANVVEHHIGRPRAHLSHLVVTRRDAQTWGIGGHGEGGDPVRGALRLGAARKDHEQVGDRRVGDVPLGPVQHPFVAVAGGGHRQICRARSGLGLGQRKRRGQLAARQLRQQLPLLLLGATEHQHLPGDPVVGAEHRAERRGRPAQLEGQLDFLRHRQPDPTALLRDREPEQPQLFCLLADPLRDVVRLVDLGLQGHHLLTHEPPDLPDHLGERVGIDSGIAHPASLMLS
jgi:hypothetical protein